MNDNLANKRQEELEEFLMVLPQEPPEHLSQAVLSDVSLTLNPPAWRVFTKLAGIHVFAGAFSLLLCPQFGMGASNYSGLSGLFMRLGEHGCAFACGAVFLLGTAAVASLTLAPAELQVVRKAEILNMTLLGLLSLAAFVCAGAAVALVPGFLWLLGSTLSGGASFKGTWATRRWIMMGMVQ